jgi:hypothetical protein
VPEEYGPWQWAAPYAGRFGGDAFSVATKTGPCAVQQGPACGSRKSVKKMPSRERATYVAFRTDCQKCSLREQCLASKAKGDRARRVSAVRRLLPQPSSVERKPVVLGPMRLSWMWQGVHFDAHGQPTGVDNMLRCFHCLKFSPRENLLVRPGPFVRAIVGEGLTDWLATQASDHRKCVSMLLVFPPFSSATNTGGMTSQRSLFRKGAYPSESIRRARVVCLLTVTSLFFYGRLVSWKRFHFPAEARDIAKAVLKLLHLRGTARCASRGKTQETRQKGIWKASDELLYHVSWTSSVAKYDPPCRFQSAKGCEVDTIKQPSVDSTRAISRSAGTRAVT